MTPVDEALATLDRRRRDRAIVVAVLLVAVLAALALLVVDDEAVSTAPWVAAAFLAVAVGYGIVAVREERRARATVAALLAERERAMGLTARVEALATLERAVRELTLADDLAGTFDRLLDTALALTDARTGAVLLLAGHRLTVAGARGPGAPARGDELEVGDGPAWTAVERGEPVVSGRGAEWAETTAGASSIAAPLTLPGRTVGALVVERDAERPAFGPSDRAAVALFAEHAALAVRSAWRLDAERARTRELEQGVAASVESAAGVVHDLKAPLSAVSGYVALLRERDERFTPERRRRLLDDVLGELDRVRGLVDALVRVAAAEAGDLAMDQRVDLVEVARGAVRTGHGLATAQGARRDVTLRLDGDQAPPGLGADTHAEVVVTGDVASLERVVANLVDNAVAHTPPGSPVEVAVGADADRAVLRVRDHGAGLGNGRRERSASERGGTHTATGLGLQVVHSLVAAHGGEVRLDPAEGGGTVAEVELPLAGLDGR